MVVDTLTGQSCRTRSQVRHGAEDGSASILSHQTPASAAGERRMAEVVGGSVAVVEADGFHIDELAGNVATKEDTLSIAFVSARAGASEPWLTLHYDEWIAVRTGSIAIEQEGLANVTVRAGQTVKISKGTRFRPSFPEDTTYIPVCIPAFSPSRCIREDVTEEGKDVALNLKKLHVGCRGRPRVLSEGQP